MSSLQQIIQDAIHQINTYRNPDISDAQERINKILTAAGLGTTGNDRITSLSISGQGDQKKVYISTSYSVRGCEQSDDFEFPVSLLESADPVIVATQWGIEQSIAELRDEVAQAKRTFERCTSELSAKEKELSDLLTNREIDNPSVSSKI